MQTSKPTDSGSQLKNFVPLGKIGQGSFSSVYKVRRVDDGKIYALKKVKLGSLKPKQKQSALSEINILASFHSPNIVSYKEAFFEKGSQELCIILEWANEGDIIADINARKKQRNMIPESQIWRAIIDILCGLHTLHSNSVIHRDIKSANIFKSEGIYKLGDLNIAKICGGMAYTQTGTPYYASPQVWKQLPYDAKSDIWSLGCVIYEMCQLDPPFKAKDMNVLYKNVISGKYPHISSMYSSQLKRVVDYCLQIDSRKRKGAIQLLECSQLHSKAREYRICIPELVDISKPVKMRHISSRALTEPTQLQNDLPQPNYGNDSYKQIEESHKKKRILILPSKKAKLQGIKGIRPKSNYSKINRTQTSQDRKLMKNNSNRVSLQKNVCKNRQQSMIQNYSSSKARNRPMSAVQQSDVKHYNLKTDINRRLCSQQDQSNAMKYYYLQQKSTILRNHIINNSYSKNYLKGMINNKSLAIDRSVDRQKGLQNMGAKCDTKNQILDRYTSNKNYDTKGNNHDTNGNNHDNKGNNYDNKQTRILQNTNSYNNINNKNCDKKNHQKSVEIGRNFMKEKKCIQYHRPYVLGSVKELPRIKDLFARNNGTRMGIRKYL